MPAVMLNGILVPLAGNNTRSNLNVLWNDAQKELQLTIPFSGKPVKILLR